MSRGVIGVLSLGIALCGLGASFVLDVRSVGTRAIRLSLYFGAMPWSRHPQPAPERIDRHRLAFGIGLVLFGVIVIVDALSSA